MLYWLEYEIILTTSECDFNGCVQVNEKTASNSLSNIHGRNDYKIFQVVHVKNLIVYKTQKNGT